MTDNLHGWLSEDEVVLHRLEAFHYQRVEAVVSGATPINVRDEGRLVVHLIPEVSVRSRPRFSAADLKKHGHHIPALGNNGRQARINADGFVVFDGRNDARAYSQLYRDGRLEAVMSEAAFESERGVRLLRDTICEQAVIDVLPVYFKFCTGIGVKPPVWLFATLTGCEGVRFQVDYGFPSDLAIDRTTLHLPELKIDSFDVNSATFLRPLCDALWNAAGYERSGNYDEAGNRRDRGR